MVWWWHLLRKPPSWALSLTASSVVCSLSLFCLVSLSLSVILWPFELLSPCVDTSGGIDPLGVFPLFLKKVANIIAPKLSMILGSSVWYRFRSVGGHLM